MIPSVSPIPYGLRKDETVFEVINNLQKLDHLIENIFKTLDEKIESFRPILSDINCRTTNCSIKLSQLKTWGTRATKVFSSHKYPKTELFDDKTILKSVCTDINNKLQTESNSQSFVSDFNNNTSKRFGQLVPFAELLIDEKIKFFNASSGGRKRSEKCNPLYERIGSIQWQRIHSLSSLLIFNTSDIAFISRSQKSSDLRQNQTKDIVDGRQRLDSAPKSMTTHVEDINELYFLSGSTGPQIMDSLPVFLPSLPGIADEFVTDENVAQIDSNVEKANQSLLPNFLPILPNIQQIVSDKSSQIINSNENNLPIPPTPQLPPPPPPPPPALLTEPNVASGTKVISPIAAPPPPPLPPTISQSLPIPPPPSVGPPLPPPPPPQMKEPPVAPKSTSVPTMNIDNGRAGLLESIRMAGGKPKPKTIKDKKMDKKLKIKENKELGIIKPNSGGGGDLMSDLANRLSLRRSGIRGDQKSPAGKAQPQQDISAMDRISAMIPPPKPVSDNELSANESEDEWN